MDRIYMDFFISTPTFSFIIKFTKCYQSSHLVCCFVTVFPHVQTDPPVSGCAHCLWSPLRKFWLYPLSTHLFRYLYRLVWSSLNLLSSRLDSPSSLYLSLHKPWKVQSPVCLCGASLGSLQCTHVSVLGSPEPDTALQVSPGEGIITSPDLLATLWLMQLMIALALFAIETHCWLRLNLISIRTRRSFPAKLLSSWMAPSHPNHSWSGWEPYWPQCALTATCWPPTVHPSEPGCSSPAQSTSLSAHPGCNSADPLWGPYWRQRQLSAIIMKYLVPPLIQIDMYP